MKSIKSGFLAGIVLCCVAALLWKAEAGVQDTDFWTDAAEGSMAEVALSNAAIEKSQNDAVKQFAQRMVTDHTQAGQELTQLASSKSVTIPTTLSDKRQRDVTNLQAKETASFDREYMQMMVKDHERAVRLYERQTERGIDAELKAFATKMLPPLRQHLADARTLNDAVRGRRSDGGNSSNVNSSTNVRQDDDRNPNRTNNSNSNDNSNRNSNANVNTNSNRPNNTNTGNANNGNLNF